VDPLRAVGLALYVLVTATVSGLAVLRLCGLAGTQTARAERLLLATTLGLGVQALALTLLGLLGLMTPPLVRLTPLALGAAALTFATRLLPSLGTRSRTVRLTGLEKVAVALLMVLGACVALSGLAPPTDYDGLLYHLVAPRTYLEAGGLVYISHNFSANLPAFGEMLFAVGLAGGSDRAPQLIHAAAGALSVGLTWALGARVARGPAASWSAVALAATPLVPFLSTRAYIDLFTVMFATASLLGVIRWMDTERRSWLALAGGMLGFALATKYALLTLAAPAGVGVVIVALTRRHVGRSWRFRRAAEAGVMFGGCAVAAALPWYARQVVLLGNPVWPMYFGGRDWGPVRVEQLTYFVSQYGSVPSPLSWLRLPLDVYIESWRFGHVPFSFPPVIALLGPFALLDRRPAVRWLLAVAAAVCLSWARGWQDLRFLLTLYPVLAVLGTVGALAVLTRWRHGVSALGLALVVALAITTAREAQRAGDRLGVVTGAEPVQAYLERSVSNHRAVTYLNQLVPPSESVLFLGDGQVWYCQPRCIPDPAHDNLLVWIIGSGQSPAVSEQSQIDMDATARRLADERVRHILLSKKDFWYLEQQDPEDRLRRQLDSFYVFKARYLDLVYEDGLTEVYRGRW